MKKKNTPPSKVFRNFGYAFMKMLTIYPEEFIINFVIRIIGTFLVFFSNAYMLRYIVNGVQEGRSIQDLVGYVVVIVILNIVFGIVRKLCDEIVYPIIGSRSDMRLNRIIYRKSAEIDVSNYENPKAYERYNKAVSNGADAIEGTMRFILNAINVIQTFSLNTYIILLIDPVLFIFAFLPLIFGIFQVRVSKKQYDYKIRTQEIGRRKDYTRRSFYLSEYAKEMRLTNISRVMQRNFADSIKELVHVMKTDGLKVAVEGFFVTGVGQLISIYGAEIYAVYHTIVSKTIMVGDCLVILNSFLSLSSIRAVARWYTDMYDIALNVQDFRDFVELEPSVSLNPDGPASQKGDIEIRNVSFRYDGADSDTLKNVNMNIRKGEKICIVGHNGAGKTTLVKLLMRLYDVNAGVISVAGRDIKEYNLQSYRESYGVVFQDYKQMSLTVAENVLGRPYRDEDEETVINALIKAGLWEKISGTEKGIHSVITREFDSDGLVLSGGESQKLSIASVYARDCNIVILDEPSSALDPLAEHEMYENMKKACENKTMIFISHRLSSAVTADRVFLMDEGTVKESGTHSELMKQNGIYAELFRIQAQNYTDNIGEGGQEHE